MDLDAALRLVFYILLSAVVIPYVNSKIDESKRTKLKGWIDIAVRAAEQIFSDTGAGDEKKAYVLNFLAEKGEDVSSPEIDVLVEASVLEMNRR